MDLNDFQKRATETDQVPGTEGDALIVPLLGMAGEVYAYEIGAENEIRTRGTLLGEQMLRCLRPLSAAAGWCCLRRWRGGGRRGGGRRRRGAEDQAGGAGDGGAWTSITGRGRGRWRRGSRWHGRR